MESQFSLKLLSGSSLPTDLVQLRKLDVSSIANMTGSQSFAIRPVHDETAREYFHHSSAQRVNTDIVIVEALRKQYPEFNVVIAPQDSCNLLAYAGAGHAIATPIEDTNDPIYAPVKWRQYLPPARRLDHQPGALVDMVLFGIYMYSWNNHEFIVYIVNGRDGTAYYPAVVNNYILTKESYPVDQLIIAATQYSAELHNEVWVFDQGYWQKSGELWQSVQHSKWDDVILDPGMKKAIIDDVQNFFSSRDTYSKLKVPWKRGILYYGPPGNGKALACLCPILLIYSPRQDYLNQGHDAFSLSAQRTGSNALRADPHKCKLTIGYSNVVHDLNLI